MFRLGQAIRQGIGMAVLCLVVMAVPAPAAPATALLFDGVDDRVTFGTATNLSSFTFTLETWFKRTGAGVGANTGSGGYADAIPLIAKGRGEADGDTRDMNYILAIRAADSRLVSDFEEGGAGPSPGLNHPVAGNTVLTNNGWYHAAVTYDGAEWRLYLNGALETNLYVGRPVRGDSISTRRWRQRWIRLAQRRALSRACWMRRASGITRAARRRSRIIIGAKLSRRTASLVAGG